MERGYTIPIVDISGQTFRQTVVDRESGVYLGHPTTVLLEDGKTMFIVYPKNHGNGQIVLKKSTDAGLTWSERLPVPDSWSSSLEVPTIYRTYSKDAGRHLIMFSGLRPIRMAHSEDDGETWSELEPIGTCGGIVAMGDVKEIGKGRYLAMFHDDGRFMRDGDIQKMYVYRTGKGVDMRTCMKYEKVPPDDTWELIYESSCNVPYTDSHFVLYQCISEDGGLTWSEPEAILSHPQAQLCEPGIVRSPDGKQLTVLLRENSRKLNGFRIMSGDNAETWSEAVEMPAALTGDRHCIRYLKDGRLFISFRDTTLESPTWGDWVGWVGTYDDIISGREGQYRVRIMRNCKNCDCAYPAIEVLEDGTVVTATYGHWTPDEMPYIVSVRFKPEELDKIYRDMK